jgi:hypothetical protein
MLGRCDINISVLKSGQKYNDVCMTGETPSNTCAFGLVLSSMMAVVAATKTHWNLD